MTKVQIQLEVSVPVAHAIATECARLRMPVNELLMSFVENGIANCRRVQSPAKPFQRGLLVSLRRSDNTEITKMRIVRTTKHFAILIDGTKYRKSDGFWVGESGIFPFPRITPIDD